MFFEWPPSNALKAHVVLPSPTGRMMSDIALSRQLRLGMDADHAMLKDFTRIEEAQNGNCNPCYDHFSLEMQTSVYTFPGGVPVRREYAS